MTSPNEHQILQNKKLFFASFQAPPSYNIHMMPTNAAYHTQ